MKKDVIYCSMQLDKTLGIKMRYIAEYEGRSRNQETIKLMRDRVREFEAEHGEILITEGQEPRT